MAVVPSSYAAVASTYVPPFNPPPTPTTALAGPTPSSTSPSNPSVPPIADPAEWIEAYLSVHRLSAASYRYAYLLWLVILFYCLLAALLHWTGFRGGPVGAAFDKWALRRRTWRKKAAQRRAERDPKAYRQPLALPANAQLLALFFLLVGPLVLSFAGPDYLSPMNQLWQLTHVFRRDDTSDPNYQPPQVTIQKAWWTSGDRLGLIAFSLFPLSVLLALKAPPFALFALPVLTSYHFDKLTRLHKWCGRLIYALVVGHVLTWSVQLAQDKQTGVSDKSAWSFVFLYQNFIYAWIAFGCFTLLVLLSIGPIRQRFYEPFHFLHMLLVPLTLIFSALHFPPLGAWCYIALGLWILERIWRWGRRYWIEGRMGKVKHARGRGNVGAGRYGGPQKLRGAREEWEMRGKDGGEKLEYDRDRSLPQLPTGAGNGAGNGYSHAYPPPTTTGPPTIDPYARTRHNRHASEASFTDSISEYYTYDTPPLPTAPASQTPPHGAYLSPVSSPRKADFGPISAGGGGGGGSDGQISPGSSVDLMHPPGTSSPPTSSSHFQYPLSSTQHGPSRIPTPAPPGSSSSRHLGIPPHQAHAVSLPGRTVRLTLRTARPVTWAPGQHILLSLPALSRTTMHPFTIACCCDRADDAQGGSEIVLLVRARKGLTKKLWAYVHARSGPGRTLAETLFTPQGRPRRGVLMQASIDGPFGSSVRAARRWGQHSSVLIVVGGSGVSFGSAIMEYLCMCMSGREPVEVGGKGKQKGWKTRRIRFVWVVREYAHIQWAAPIIRRCLDLVPRSTLQVDIFVTNGLSKGLQSNNGTITDLRQLAYQSEVFGDDDATLAPPQARFAKPGVIDASGTKGRSMSNASTDSVDSNVSVSSDADLDYASDEGGRLPRRMVTIAQAQQYPSQQRPQPNGQEEEEDILDMTNFDGEDDTRTPGEVQLSNKVRKEGRVRRAMSRRAAGIVIAKRELREKAAGGGAIREERGEYFAAPPERRGNPFQTPGASGPPTPSREYPSTPPTSYRPPTQISRPPPTAFHVAPFAFNPNSDLPRAARPPVPRYGSRSPSPTGSDDRYKGGIYSSADFYASGVGGDPLRLSDAPPPSAVRPPRSHSFGQPVRPTPGAGTPYVSDDWQAEHSPMPSTDSLNQQLRVVSSPLREQQARPWEIDPRQQSNRPDNHRNSTQSSVYTTGPAQPPSFYYGSDPAFDARTVGGGESVRSLVDRTGKTGGARTPGGPLFDTATLDLDEDEMEDLHIVSEMARPGRPRLDRILADEVERSAGAVSVACCGPSSLNAMVRKVVAAQISPSRILRGDKRGLITLVTEDFEW